ncbi:hypothetical protein GW17_00058962, partial [Ensete ventricosum]
AVAARVQLRQREEGAAECTIVVEEGSSSVERETCWLQVPSKATRKRDSRAWPSHLQGGDRLQPRPPCKGAAGCGQAPYKGRPPAGAAAHKGQPPTGVASRKGRLPARACRPWPGRKRRLPAARPKGAVARGALTRGRPLVTLSQSTLPPAQRQRRRWRIGGQREG